MNSRTLAAICLAAAIFLNYGSAGILVPDVAPSPVPGSGLHVLIVEDRLQRQSLPPSQLDAMMSADVDELIRKHNGRKYVYDQHQDLSAKDDPWVIAAMKLSREKLPWLVVDYNGNGSSQPFPADQQAFRAVLEGYVK